MGCKPETDGNLINSQHESFDPNYIALPKEWKLLNKAVRDVWRDWKGQWLNEIKRPVERCRPFEIGEEVFDNDSVQHFSTVERVFGKHV